MCLTCDQIGSADVAIKAAEALGMYDVASQIIAKRASLIRQARSPVELRATYYTGGFDPVTLPVESIKKELDWFRRGMTDVSVSTLRWGEDGIGGELRLMMLGKDPVNGANVRAYIHAEKKDEVCPRCAEGVG